MQLAVDEANHDLILRPQEFEANLFTYSEEIEHADWQPSQIVDIVPNNAITPDGLQTADQVDIYLDN